MSSLKKYYVLYQNVKGDLTIKMKSFYCIQHCFNYLCKIINNDFDYEPRILLKVGILESEVENGKNEKNAECGKQDFISEECE